MDGDVTTAWAEGAVGDGEGEWVEIEFPDTASIDGFILHPGYLKSEQTFVENAVPQRIGLIINDTVHMEYLITYALALHVSEDEEDPEAEREVVRGMGCYHTADRQNFGPRVVLFQRAQHSGSLQLRIAEGLSGSRSHDLYISEWSVLFSGEAAHSPGLDARIVEVLRALRNDLNSVGLTPNAAAEDLRRKYVPRDPGKGFVYLDSPPVDSQKYFARVPLSERSDGNSVYDKFFKHTLSSFIDKPVVVYAKGDKTYLIGALAASYGDSEWLEFYPTIVLNRDYEIIELKELAHADGAPGCHNVIPEID
jgi:hypothetical protein